MLSYLRACRVGEIEVHSLIGHSDSVIDLILGVQAPVDLVIHDYSWFCPRISLTNGNHRYCGEPAIAGCRDCVTKNGTNFDEPVSPDELVDRTRRHYGGGTIDYCSVQGRRAPYRGALWLQSRVREWEQPHQFALPDMRPAAGRPRPCGYALSGRLATKKGIQFAAVRRGRSLQKACRSSSWL